MASVETTNRVDEETGSRKRKPHKFPAENADKLIETSRQEMLDPQSVFALLPLRVYHHIADIGCGPGYFTVPLAKYAFDGKVYAIDMQQAMLDRVKTRLEESRLHNVELVLSKETKIPLDGDSVNGAIIVNTLHEATQPKTMLKEALRLIHRGGWAAIIDWRAEEMEEGPPLEERLARDHAVALAKEAGFQVGSCYDLNKWHYFIALTYR